MKKYILFYIMLMVSLIFASCEDVLDLEPSDATRSDQAFNRIEDFQVAVDGLYALMRSTSNGYGQTHFLYPDILSDNCIMNFDGRKSYQSTFNWEYTASDGTSRQLWARGYLIIHAANEILRNIATFTGGTEEKRNIVNGEALVIKAMVHFDLVRYYGKPYNSAISSDLGIPYMLTSNNGQPTRNTVMECYTNIEQDLLAAEALLDGTSARGNQYFSAAAVKALLARYYLTVGDYANAEANATEVINNTAYSLADSTKFVSMWVGKDQSEIILRLPCIETEGPRIGGYYSTSASSEFLPTFDFYNLFGNDDVRKNAYFTVTEMESTKKMYNFVTKYHVRKGVEDSAQLADIIVFRLPEMYLIRAEARIKGSPVNEAGALADLNLLRANRYSPYTAGTEGGNALETAILLERRLELAFEGHRYFDLQRMGMDVVRDANGHLYNGDGVKLESNLVTLLANDDERIWPIPQSERDANPNITQNDGY